MHILEVQIDRFGQFHQWSCTFSNSKFLTIFGPNEAGKSTLVAFIKCIFFGFPRKSELEPYIGGEGQKGSLGGSVTLLVSDVGKVKIVRHYQRKNGQAAIYLENGEVIGEDTLSEWLKGIDRELYDAIFCFDLDGLKGIDRLKPDELNRFLFSTGMMGNAELYDLEKALDKEAGELFKTGGRNPVINQTISDLNSLRGKISSWENQMDEYTALKRETEDLSIELEKLDAERSRLEEEKREFLRFKACESLLIDYGRIEKEMAALGDTALFPEDGKARYDHWRTLSVSLQGELSDTEQKMETVQEELLKYGSNDSILSFEKEIADLIKENNEKGTWERELAKLGEQQRQERDAIQEGLGQLNLSIDDLENIKTLPVSLSVKQSLKDWMGQWQDAVKRKAAYDISVEEEAGKLQSLKEKRRALQNELMPEERFHELEQQNNNFQPDKIEKERDQLHREWSTVKRGREMDRLLGRFKMGLPLGIMVLFMVSMGILVSAGHFVTGLVSILIGLFLSGILWSFVGKLQNRFKTDDKERDIVQRLKELEAIETIDVSQSQYLYKQEKDKRDQISFLAMQISDGELSCQSYIEKLEQTNLKIIEIENGIGEWRRSIGLPECKAAILPEVYQLAEKLREQILRLENLKKQAAEFQSLLNSLDEKIKGLGERLGDPDINLNECIARLDHAKKILAKKDKLEENLKQLQENHQSLNGKISRYEDECQKLLEQAGADSEEEFYRLAALADQLAALKEQHNSLERQLTHNVPQEETRNIYFSWIKEGYFTDRDEDDFIGPIDHIDYQVKEIQSRRAEAKSRIDNMEKDETYADLLHDYEEKRFFLNEEAKKWGTIHIALSLLKQAKENYRETRLPKVLASASHYLNHITNRSYIKIYYTEADGFTIERTDGLLFKAGELSRGTSEQLYLSIRLALVDEYQKEENLPIIIDDGFVNFDEERRRQVIDVLKSVGNERQVLLFTCHRYQTKDIFELSSLRHNGGGFANVGSVISDSAG